LTAAGTDRFRKARREWLAGLELPIDKRLTQEAVCVSSTSSTPRSAEQIWLTSSFDRADLAFFGRLAGDHRLKFVGDGDELHPGMTGRLSPSGHTFGIQWLTIEMPEGPVVIGSDASMWFSNIEEMWPSGYTNGNTFQMLMTYGEISQYLNGDLDRLVPGHDMKVFDRHPPSGSARTRSPSCAW
jgi:hypothetical protein